MKPLVLTGWLTPDFIENDFADLTLDLALFDFIWGQQPSPDELAAHLGPRTAKPQPRQSHTLVGLGR